MASADGRDSRHWGVPVERLTPEKRRAMTRAHLLAAAAEVFAERGYSAATLDQIADAAGFSKGAVYSNFASKDDLFLALIQEQSESMVREYAQLDEADDSDPASRIAALADVYLRRDADLTQAWALNAEFDLWALRNPEVQRRLVEGSRAVRDLVTDLVQRHFDERRIEPPLPPAEIASLYIAIFQGLWQQKAMDPDTVADDLAARAIVLLSRAFDGEAPPKRGGSSARGGASGRRQKRP
jgi:AcrR family transcriptional regulator